MSTHPDTVQQNMAAIETVFRQVQQAFDERLRFTQLLEILHQHRGPFLSVAYEAASMCLALEDMKRYPHLQQWNAFLEQHARAHVAQYHVGLGWALSQQQSEPAPWLNLVSPAFHDRVLDGMGYYDGFFRKRKSIWQQLPPEQLPIRWLPFYDQGLGRSIWYTAGGNADEAFGHIDRFIASRQPSLWRGLGIAVTYAGGCCETTLLAIRQRAGDQLTSLREGARLAWASRKAADCMTPDAELTLRIWN